MEVPLKELELRDDPGVLSAPILAPAYACATTVNVTGYVHSAQLDVEIDGSIAVSGFSGDSPAPHGAVIPLPNPLVTGQTLRTRQERNGVFSPWSSGVVVRDHTQEFPAGPPRPELFQVPLYQCGERVGVGNLLVGCEVRVTADTNPRGSVSGANNPQGVNISPAFATGEHVRAWATLCNDPSPPSLEQIVQSPPVPLAAPGFDPIYEGGTELVVNNIVNGAHFTLSRNGVQVGTWACWGGRCLVGLNPAFSAGEVFSATQQLCIDDPSSPPGEGSVQACSALPAPQVGPIQDGDVQIVITDFVAGSQIRVFVNGIKRGEGSGPVVTVSPPIPHGATVHVWQILGSCEGETVQEVISRCVAPPVSGDPSYLNLFPVGTREYHDSGNPVSFDGFSYEVRGSIYYPADDDGVDTPFNSRLAGLGRVPIVVCVHGAHSDTDPSYQGYDYFQTELARMGFVAISVDERETDEPADWPGWTQNIVRRADLAIASIAYMQQLDSSDPILGGKIDFSRTGLMGHSRGGDCVIAVAERITLPGVSIGAVLSLAPVNSGANSGRPQGYPFMTFLPAADGDVRDNNGAEFYDQAVPGPYKVQLYIHHANHNYFNRIWLNDDTGGGLPIMSRGDHERILSTHGCAFFRHALRGDETFAYLNGSRLPTGVQNQNIHLAYAIDDSRVIDNYEGHPITEDNEGQPTDEIDGLVAAQHQFHQGGGAFNASFFGETTGNVSISKENTGAFREPLRDPVDLTDMEVRVRAAEVYQAPNMPSSATGFRIGVEDTEGTIAWVDIDEVGGLPRPFDRRSHDSKTKTMLATFRFPGHCFMANEQRLNITSIRAIHLGLNRGEGRPVAFDDVDIVKA